MSPPTDLETVIGSQIKCAIFLDLNIHCLLIIPREWHFRTSLCHSYRALHLTFPDIYFHQNNAEEHRAALELRDSVLSLRQNDEGPKRNLQRAVEHRLVVAQRRFVSF